MTRKPSLSAIQYYHRTNLLVQADLWEIVVEEVGDVDAAHPEEVVEVEEHPEVAGVAVRKVAQRR